MSTLSFVVTFRGSSHPISVPPSTPLSEDLDLLFTLTLVPPELQKLLVKGKSYTLENAGERTLEGLAIKDGSRVMLVGTPQAAVEEIKQKEEEDRRREKIIRERKTGKLRSTGSASSSTPSLTYRFHSIVPLAHLPDPPAATALLTRLANDPAIRHIMETHRFAVGVLTELAPHEHPNLLGLNVNKGEQIKLRLRTDRYDGFRLYGDVRRVLVHELTHNVFGDHDDDFKELNSQMNKEVAAYELSLRANTHTFRSGDVYEPGSQTTSELEAHQHVLGGASGAGSVGESVDERRRRVLEAAVRRAQQEEEELESMCGNVH